MNSRLTAALAASLAAAVAAPAPPAAAQARLALYDAPVVAVVQDRRMEALLDLDGDGDMDAIGTWFNVDRDAVLTAFVNDGTGKLNRYGFEAVLGDRVSTQRTTIVTGRLDGDSSGDFALNVGREARLYRGDPGALVPYAAVLLPADVTTLALADFDGNGYDDLVVTYSDSAATYLNDGAGGLAFAALVQPWAAADVPQLFVTEVDGDGLADLGAAVTAASTTVFLWSMAGGIFSDAGTEFLPGVTDPMPASGDVDGDGDEDIVIFRMETYVTFRRDGPSSFAVEPETRGGPATNLADVDADGDLDGVCCGGGGGPSAPNNTAPSIFRVAQNDGSGAFAPAFEMQGLGARHLAGAADMNGDGHVDLVAGRCIYFAPGPIVDPYSRIPDAGPSPDHVLPLLDGDGDGDLDAQFSFPSCRANRADGTFTIDAALVASAPSGGRLVGPGLPGDFDGDGDPDLIVRHESAETGLFVSMRLLVNRGAGRLADGGDALPGQKMFEASHPRTVHVVADIDSDGDLDVVAHQVRAVSGPANSWLNDGAGAFSGYQSLPDETVLAVHDFDRDGEADAVTLYRESVHAYRYRLMMRRGVGSGWFGDPVVLIEDEYRIATRLVVADFDRDGDFDLVTDEPPFRILENDGAGSFGPGPGLRGPEDGRFVGPTSVVLTDANGDGLPDAILTTPTASAGMSAIYVQTPRGFEYATFQMFVAVAAADIDGDGDEDLLSDAYVRGSAPDAPRVAADHFIRNRRFERPGSGSCLQYGTGLAGSDGITPILGAASPFRPGERREYRIVGGLGGARAFLAIGLEEAATPRRGGTLLVGSLLKTRKIRLGGAAGVPGAGSWIFSQGPTPARFARRTFYLQAIAVDPGAAEGFSFTNGLRVSFGD